MERRYQVVTYSHDIGADERRDYGTMAEAVKAARGWLRSEEAAYVYDTKRGTVRHAWKLPPEYAFNPRAITPACIMHN